MNKGGVASVDAAEELNDGAERAQSCSSFGSGSERGGTCTCRCDACTHDAIKRRHDGGSRWLADGGICKRAKFHVLVDRDYRRYDGEYRITSSLRRQHHEIRA